MNIMLRQWNITLVPTAKLIIPFLKSLGNVIIRLAHSSSPDGNMVKPNNFLGKKKLYNYFPILPSFYSIFLNFIFLQLALHMLTTAVRILRALHWKVECVIPSAEKMANEILGICQDV